NYFGRFFNPLLGNPERQLFLRWTDVITKQTKNYSPHSHPDAVVSTLCQPTFSDGYGYGEAKISGSTRNTYSLCRDLLRLIFFCKTSINDDITSSGTVSIHICFYLKPSFDIRFYGMELKHEPIYLLTELAHVEFPNSLE
ncbi:hypothetical protein BJV82DRAFT_516871, partial [Fennellomyces sp. T-0311]